MSAIQRHNSKGERRDKMETYIVTATVEIYVEAESEDAARNEIEGQLGEICSFFEIDDVTC
jgi:hypothetical protein